MRLTFRSRTLPLIPIEEILNYIPSHSRERSFLGAREKKEVELLAGETCMIIKPFSNREYRIIFLADTNSFILCGLCKVFRSAMRDLDFLHDYFGDYFCQLISQSFRPLAYIRDAS